MHEQRVLSLANATTSVLHSASLAISAIGAGLAGIRGLVPKHAIKQVDRLLSNPKFDLDSLATSWVPSLLADRKEAVLALDWTDFDADDHTTLALNLITNHGRASMLCGKPFANRSWRANATTSRINSSRNWPILSDFISIIRSTLPSSVTADSQTESSFSR